MKYYYFCADEHTTCGHRHLTEAAARRCWERENDFWMKRGLNCSWDIYRVPRGEYEMIRHPLHGWQPSPLADVAFVASPWCETP